MPAGWAESLGGVVATEETLASFVGASALARGGNAVDAALTASLALAVLVPHLGGVGGDFFLLYRSPDGRVYFVNGSGQAPSRLSKGELASRALNSIPERGPLSPVVPGMLGGVFESWRRLGSLEWRHIVEPARSLAAKGFPLPPSTARALSRLRGCLSGDRGSRLLLKTLGSNPGSPARLTGLAALLEGYMEDPWYPYRGEPAESLEEYMAEVGGLIETADLRSYRPYEDEPVKGEYRGVVIYEMPPNSQGISTLHMLYMLEEASVKAPPFSRERAETLARVARPVYSVRDKFLGDPKYMELTPEELADRERALNLLKKEAAGGGGAALRGAGDTTFLAAADGEGGVAVAIQSLFYPFGSCVTEPRFQITLNNRALGFTMEEGLPSTLRPGARPLHTLSAVIMVMGDGRVIGLGASGGHLRPQQHALFITNIIDYGMNVYESINTPRALLDPSTGRIMYEEGWESGGGWVKAERLGVANAVEVRGKVSRGYTDRRGDGLPVPAIKVRV